MSKLKVLWEKRLSLDEVDIRAMFFIGGFFFGTIITMALMLEWTSGG